MYKIFHLLLFSREVSSRSDFVEINSRSVDVLVIRTNSLLLALDRNLTCLDRKLTKYITLSIAESVLRLLTVL